VGELFLSVIKNVHKFSDVRQIEIDTAEPLLRDPISFEVRIAIAKLEIYISPGSDQIPSILIMQEVKYYVLRSIT
jgi:hypothetical protein